MDIPSDNSKMSPDNKAKIFVLSPDKVKQLGIAGLLKQIQTTSQSTDSLPSTSTNTESVENVEKNDTKTEGTVSQTESNIISVKKSGMIMKNKLSPILLKTDIKPTLSVKQLDDTVEKTEENNGNMNLSKNKIELDLKLNKNIGILKEKHQKEPDDSKMQTSKVLESIKEVEKLINPLKSEKPSILKVNTSDVQNVRLGSFKNFSLVKSTIEKTVEETEKPNKPSSILEGPKLETMRLGSFKKLNLSSQGTPKESTQVKSDNIQIGTFKKKLSNRLNSFKSKNITSLKNILTQKLQKSLSIDNKDNFINEVPKIDEKSEGQRKSSRPRKNTFLEKDYILDTDFSRIENEPEAEKIETKKCSNEDDLDSSLSENLNNTFKSVEIKKRGRPKKIKIDTDTSLINSASVEKRKPGRPRKTIQTYESSSENEETTNLDETLETTEGQNETEADTNLEMENLPKIKRTPGRPRKTIKIETVDPETNSNETSYILDDSAIENEEQETKKRKVGRPRKSIIKNEPMSFDDSDDEFLKRKTDDLETECPRKKFCRKIIETQESNTSFDDQDNSIKEKEKKRKKIYPPVTEEQFKKAVSTLEGSHLSKGKKKKSVVKEEEECRRIISKYYTDMGMVTCGKCNKELSNNVWLFHNMEHMNLGWRVGEAEIDINDERKVLSILVNLQRKNDRFKFLTCEKCGIKKKSAVGYYSHMTTCQKPIEEILQMRVTCTLCGRSYARSSIKTHLATTHVKSRNELDKLESDDEYYDGDGILKEDQTITNVENRRKRKAAEKASNLIIEVVDNDNDDRIKAVCNRRLTLACRYPNSAVGILSVPLVRKFCKELKMNQKIKCRFKDCDFTAESLEEIKSHIKQCKDRFDNDYICRFCLHTTQTEEEFLVHMETLHAEQKHMEYKTNDDIVEDDDDEKDVKDDVQVLLSKQKHLPQSCYKGKAKIAFLNAQRCGPATANIIYPGAFYWTYELHLECFSPLLFKQLLHTKTDWNLIQNEYSKYLPVTQTSMDVEFVEVTKSLNDNQGTERNWRKFDLFESEIHEGSTTIYCGGPIWAMAWAPTPDNTITDQYLAVSCLREHDKNFTISENYTSAEMIQFWNYGTLQAKDGKIKPKLEFCLAHDHGNIWCMEWCPSGCFNDDIDDVNKLPRLGMLVLACTDGKVPIYTISLDDTENNDVDVKIYRTKPTFELIVGDNIEQNLGLWPYQARKVTWSKCKGHNIVAAGYTTGIVCLWNLNTISPLLRSEKDGVIILKPYHVFKAHDGLITALCMSPMEGGKKWLFTGSIDKYSKYWDLENTLHPITSHYKNTVSDGCWISHWMMTYLGYDDSMYIQHTTSTMQAMRNFMCEQFTGFPTNSAITSTSSNDWGNQIAQGNFAGDLVAIFPHQLLVSCDADKSIKCKRMFLAFSELVEKAMPPQERIKKVAEKTEKYAKTQNKLEKQNNVDDKDIIKEFINKKKDKFDCEEENYEDAQNKYGLVFNHFNMKEKYIIPEVQSWCRKGQRSAPIMMYPLMAINRIAWNPNQQSFLYIASGYNAGFVRVQYISHLNKKHFVHGR